MKCKDITVGSNYCYIGRMKAKSISLLYAGLIGATISLIGTAITKWGKVNSQREGITILLSVLCVAVLHVLRFKYLRENEVVNTKNKWLGLVALWIAIIIGVTVSILLLKIPD